MVQVITPPVSARKLEQFQMKCSRKGFRHDEQDLQDVFHKPHDSRFLHPVNPFLAVFSGQWVATSPEPEGFKER